MTKRIVVLASSRKHWTSAEHDGRCVAGTEWDEPLTWLRPVSAREGEEVSRAERLYEDETEPRLLDVVDIPLLEARPDGHQNENWLLDPEAWWEKVDECEWDELDESVVEAGPLWINGSASTPGENNRVPTSQIRQVADSLRLLHLPSPQLNVAWVRGRKSVEGRFNFDGIPYEFRVTDPVIETAYRQRRVGSYRLGECYVTVSLGEQYGPYFYKFIAGVIEKT